MNAPHVPYIGQSVKRKEDQRFLTGGGTYTDDVSVANQTHAYFLRSPHAHAKIRGINIIKAKAAPGVVGIFTGDDLLPPRSAACPAAG